MKTTGYSAHYGTSESGSRGSFDLISTRIYIILAAITGVVILVAFAVQVIVGRQ
jgi:hypothetical protein